MLYHIEWLKLVLCFQAEIELNLQKRRGHGLLSVLRPKFSGVLGEALDVAARWSGDVVSTLPKGVCTFLVLMDDWIYCFGPSLKRLFCSYLLYCKFEC